MNPNDNKIVVSTNPLVSKFIRDHLTPFTPTKQHLFGILIEMLYDESRTLLHDDSKGAYNVIMLKIMEKYHDNYSQLPKDEVIVTEFMKMCVIVLPEFLETLLTYNLLYDNFTISQLTETTTVFHIFN